MPSFANTIRPLRFSIAWGKSSLFLPLTVPSRERLGFFVPFLSLVLHIFAIVIKDIIAMQKKSLIPRSVCCYLVAALCAFSVLSCTTSRTATSTVTHSEGDSLRALSAQYAAVSQQLSRYDSLFAQMQARITAQQSTQEQSTERIQESVTTYLDSLGREVRQENRTIDRNLSRQTELRYEQQISSLQQQLSQETARTDSLSEALYMLQQVNWLDSLNQQSYKEPAPSRIQSWWDGLVLHLGYIALFGILGVLIFLVARYFLCK